MKGFPKRGPLSPLQLPKDFLDTQLLKFIKQVRNIVIQLYRNIGIIIVCLILFLVVGYLITICFFIFNHRWALPMILSPYSEKVMVSRTSMANTKAKYDELILEKMQLRNRIKLIEKEIELNLHHLSNIEESLRAENKVKEKNLETLIKINQSYNGIFSKSQYDPDSIKKLQKNLKKNYQSGLLDKNSLYQSQLTLQSHLVGRMDMEVKRMEIANKVEELKREISSLKSFNPDSEAKNITVSSPKMLGWIKEFRKLTNENQKLYYEKNVLQTRINLTSKGIEEFKEIMAAISESPYFKAISEVVTIAFVPYDNLKNVENDRPVYSCRWFLLWCEKVGKVERTLEGEVQLPHPFFNKKSRGLMVFLKLEKLAGKNDLLHLGKRPWLPF